VSPGFGGCHGTVDQRQRRAGQFHLSWTACKKVHPVAAMHYRYRSESFQLDIELGRVIGGWQWRAADRRCASRCGHSSRHARGLGVAFVGALCRRINSQGVDPRSLNWKISSPGKSAGPKPRALGRPATCARRPGELGLGRSSLALPQPANSARRLTRPLTTKAFIFLSRRGLLQPLAPL
jgi:hypothetical protein